MPHRNKLIKIFLYTLASLTASGVFYLNFSHPAYLRSLGGTEVSLAISGENISDCADWHGKPHCQTTWDFGYDIDRIPWEVLSEDLQKKIGGSSESLERYIKSRPFGAFVYLPLTEGMDGTWSVSGKVVEDKREGSGSLYIRGKLNGSTSYRNSSNGLIDIGVSFPGIESSRDITPFTDFANMVLKDRRTEEAVRNSVVLSSDTAPQAIVVLDNNGNAAFREIRVGGETCISNWGTVNFGNTNCWKYYP